MSCFTKKVFESLRITAEWVGSKHEIVSKKYQSLNRIVIGKSADKQKVNVFQIPGVTKQVEVFYKSSCPCKLWVKPGVYIKASQGNNIKYTLMGVRESRILMEDSVEYISTLKKFIGLTIEFKETNVEYIIKLRK